MLPYIVCPGCRNSTIGNVALIFEVLKKEKINELCKKHSIDPSMLTVSPHIDVDLRDIFEALHIDRICCRANINNNLKFMDYYNPI
jgi:hypothetical protein